MAAEGMMDRDQINAVIDLAHEATERHGITVRGGKKYSQVTTRVELFRRHFIGWGLETEAIHLGMAKGEPVIVRARILDPEGRIKGTGHASEIIGGNGVNSTSALENAETSAIGRALSSIGLHGGEYASLNEIEGAERKREAMNDRNADLAHEPPPKLPQHDKQTEFQTRIDGALSVAVLEAVWRDLVIYYGDAESTPAILRDRMNKRKKQIQAQDAEEMTA